MLARSRTEPYMAEPYMTEHYMAEPYIQQIHLLVKKSISGTTGDEVSTLGAKLGAR